MTTFEEKFAEFSTVLRKSEQSLATDSSLSVIKTALIAAKFDQMGGVFIQKKKKKLNGYNLFMKDRMTSLKETVTDSNKRMAQISTEWKGLTDEKKGEWKEKASQLVDAPVKLQVKIKEKRKSPKLSGYQVFVSEQMGQLGEIKPKERMSKIGELWKQQSEEQKAGYKLKAEERTRAKLAELATA